MPVFVRDMEAWLYDRIERCVGAVILKRMFCAKDLPRCLRQKCRVLALDQKKPGAWAESLESAILFEIFREILRAKDALQDDKMIERIPNYNADDLVYAALEMPAKLLRTIHKSIAPMTFVSNSIFKQQFSRVLILIAMCAFSFGCFGQSAPTSKITIEGTIRTASGEPIADALVSLRLVADGKASETKSDAHGTFIFDLARPGIYVITAQKAASNSEPQPISIQAGVKHVDLVLGPQAVDSAKMEFADKPAFAIAGVTDWSGAGGHGSETGLRTSEALTKQTIALNSNTTKSGESVAIHSESDVALRDEREQIQKALARNNEADLHRKLGDISERLNDPVAAEHEYEEAVRMDPSEVNYFSWGTELLLHRASEAAVQVFEKGAAVHPKSARMQAGLATALYADGAIDQAIASACLASDLEPNRSEFYTLMAEMQRTATSSAPCIAQDLKRFLNLQPESASANYYYAMTLWKQQRASSRSPGEADIAKLLEKAVRLDAHLGEAYLQLGMIREQNGEMEEALKNYQACILVSPDLSECHYRSGLAYRRLGDEARAKEEIGKYRQAQAAETAEIERKRNAVRQFLVVLKDQPSSVH
jgi:tetratricopeptide (TPR) repeat protein